MEILTALGALAVCVGSGFLIVWLTFRAPHNWASML